MFGVQGQHLLSTSTSVPHIVAIELQNDAIDVSLRSHKGNCVFQVLECLDKREKRGIRLKEGGLTCFVCLDRSSSCKGHVV